MSAHGHEIKSIAVGMTLFISTVDTHEILCFERFY